MKKTGRWENTSGIIFSIQRFCLDDGPGIRTTVFLKGCPLHCQWCHNAEGLRKEAQLEYQADSCLHCGRCAKVCPMGCHGFSEKLGHTLRFEGCDACGRCVRECPGGALEIRGKKVNASQVMDIVLRDCTFYRRSGGGMTLSGGEPLFQPHMALALLSLAKSAGLHTCVETSGYVNTSVLESAALVTDLFLFDLKECDSIRHQTWTGQDNTQILDNLSRLDKAGSRLRLRCPLIPGCNMRQDHYEGIAGIANNLKHIERIDLEPYHPFGLEKRKSLGMSAPYKNEHRLPAEEAEKAARALEKRTNVPVIIC